ncbi:MAG TPA: cation diffusion facilitator family transporter [Bryobacteraceae bacterium]|nr:cation diffusion facilitator family transporter [Bryobacteraceae bacterium]
MAGHSHGHRTGKLLIVSLILTCAFVIGETVAGVRSHSLALLSDAGHNFTDAIGLALAGIAFFWQRRPGNQFKTFGYHRMGVLAAFVNALILAALAMALFYESYRRLVHPEPVAESVMIWVAAVGLILNLAIAWSLDGNRADLNLRAAWVHMLGDAASCVGIIAGAIVIYFTGWLSIDAVLSLLIGAAIVWTAWDIFRDSINILLEGLPKGLKLADVTRAIRQVAGVIDVHDLHIWSLGSEAHALSCHVLIEDMPPSESDSILRNVNRVLGGLFHIHHTTIQFEHVRCLLADGSCTVGKHSH